MVSSTVDKLHFAFIIIDEANFLDKQALKLIRQQCEDCKILYIGDPAQLSPVKEEDCPVFKQGIPEAALTEVMRQAKGNPIIEAATIFRNAVVTGKWENIDIDNKHIKHVDAETFQMLAEKEMCRADWTTFDSKILAWTNETVRQMNNHLFELIHGRSEFHEGDYVLNNHFATNGGSKISTDAEVKILKIFDPTEKLGIPVIPVLIQGHGGTYFMIQDLNKYKAKVEEAQKENDYRVLEELKTLVDLRPAFALTVNKSQGSTYDKVFIDLNDIGMCRKPNHLARLLYVAISRAKNEVILTGDI
jgi:ATP-dependent exoDNAse (exonuclease V) alpha subunit